MNRSLMAALAAPLFLAACSTSAPTTTVTVTAEPRPSEESKADIAGDDATYLAFLASKGIVANSKTSIEVGRKACDAVDEGISPQILVRTAMDSGFTMDQGAAIVVAAIMTYCPWNEGKIK